MNCIEKHIKWRKVVQNVKQFEQIKCGTIRMKFYSLTFPSLAPFLCIATATLFLLSTIHLPHTLLFAFPIQMLYYFLPTLLYSEITILFSYLALLCVVSVSKFECSYTNTHTLMHTYSNSSLNHFQFTAISISFQT